MRFTYSITLRDLQNAQELHWKQTILRRVIDFSIYWLFPVLVSASLVVFLSRLGLFLADWSIKQVFFLGFTIAVLITTLGLSRQKSKRYRRQFEKTFPPKMRTAWCAVDDGGVTSAIIGTDEVVWPWKDFVHFAQNDKVTLLYLNQKRFLFFPTCALAQDQRAELNDLVARHVVKR